MNQHYSICGNTVQDLVDAFGSPLYVYDISSITHQYTRLRGALPTGYSRIYYAYKANANPDVLKIIKSLGAKIECVSPGAVTKALEAGFSSDDVIVTCNGMTQEELEFYCSHNIQINADSLHQVELFAKKYPGKKISLRINSGIGAGHHEHVITGGPRSKFGIAINNLDQARQIAKNHGCTINGLHQHIGSNVFSVDTFIEAATILQNVAKDFPQLEFLDYGGGFGVPYEPNDKVFEVEEFGTRMSKVHEAFCKEYGKNIQLYIEPGRYLVAQCGYLLSTVTDIKPAQFRTFVMLDTGMNHLLRPAMYGAHHEIINGSHPLGKPEKVAVVGNVCETSDTFAWDIPLPIPELGDVFVICNAGAYGSTMSSNYNSREKAAEIIIHDKKPVLSVAREELWKRV